MPVAIAAYLLRASRVPNAQPPVQVDVRIVIQFRPCPAAEHRLESACCQVARRHGLALLTVVGACPNLHQVPPRGTAPLQDWLVENAYRLGREYVSELKRHYA